MRLLVLGGTRYIGRHLVEHALAAGHHVTLFHRGHTGADLFPAVPRLVGDRSTGDAGLAALADGTWDVAVDFSGFLPRQVATTARLLAPRIGHYVFMSSIAVYPPSPQVGRTEETPVRAMPPGPEPDHFTGGTYGALKAACERAADTALAGRSTSIRAGLVIGPGDPWGAFPHWALAMAGDEPVRCAARPGQPVQTTDVRDLAAFLLRPELPPGPVNVMAPPITFADMLATCRRAGGGQATVRWTTDDTDSGYGAEIVQPRDGTDDGAFALSCDRALAAGFAPRPFLDTARDTIAWARHANPTFSSPH